MSAICGSAAGRGSCRRRCRAAAPPLPWARSRQAAEGAADQSAPTRGRCARGPTGPLEGSISSGRRWGPHGVVGKRVQRRGSGRRTLVSRRSLRPSGDPVAATSATKPWATRSAPARNTAARRYSGLSTPHGREHSRLPPSTARRGATARRRRCGGGRCGGVVSVSAARAPADHARVRSRSVVTSSRSRSRGAEAAGEDLHPPAVRRRSGAGASRLSTRGRRERVHARLVLVRGAGEESHQMSTSKRKGPPRKVTSAARVVRKAGRTRTRTLSSGTGFAGRRARGAIAGALRPTSRQRTPAGSAARNRPETPVEPW